MLFWREKKRGIEASQSNWSLRELKRQINSALYERLILSRDKEAVKSLAFKMKL